MKERNKVVNLILIFVFAISAIAVVSYFENRGSDVVVVPVEPTKPTPPSPEPQPDKPEPEPTNTFLTPAIAGSDEAVDAIVRKHPNSIVLVYTADWCQYCKQIKRTNLIGRAAREFRNILFVYVDVDQCKLTAHKNGITGIPAMQRPGNPKTAIPHDMESVRNFVEHGSVNLSGESSPLKNDTEFNLSIDNLPSQFSIPILQGDYQE